MRRVCAVCRTRHEQRRKTRLHAPRKSPEHVADVNLRHGHGHGASSLLVLVQPRRSTPMHSCTQQMQMQNTDRCRLRLDRRSPCGHSEMQSADALDSPKNDRDRRDLFKRKTSWVCTSVRNAILLLLCSGLLQPQVVRAQSDTAILEAVGGCGFQSQPTSEKSGNESAGSDITKANELVPVPVDGYHESQLTATPAPVTVSVPDCAPESLFHCEMALGVNDSNCSNASSAMLGEVQFQLYFPLWVTVLISTLSIALSLVTIVGNVIVLTSFFIDHQIRQATNYFIASLAVSDLLIGLFSMNFYTLYLLLDENWPLGDMLCDLWLSLDYTVCLASQYTVFFITVDRFCSVRIPAKYRNWRTDNKIIAMVTASWLIPALIFFTSIIGWENFAGKGHNTIEGRKRCVVGFADETLFNILLTIFYYWIPLVVMCGLSCGIYQVALTLSRKSDEKARRREMGLALSASSYDVDSRYVSAKFSTDTPLPQSGATEKHSSGDLHSEKSHSHETSFFAEKFSKPKRANSDLSRHTLETPKKSPRTSATESGKRLIEPTVIRACSLQVPTATAQTQRSALSSFNLVENRLQNVALQQNRSAIADSALHSNATHPLVAENCAPFGELASVSVFPKVGNSNGTEDQRAPKQLHFSGNVVVCNAMRNHTDNHATTSSGMRQSDLEATFLLRRMPNSNALITYALCASPETFACLKFVDQESVRSVSSESSAHTHTLGELLPQFRNFSIAVWSEESAEGDEEGQPWERRLSPRRASTQGVEKRNCTSPIVAVIQSKDGSTFGMLSSSDGPCSPTDTVGSLVCVPGPAGFAHVLGAPVCTSLVDDLPSELRAIAPGLPRREANESHPSLSGCDDDSSAAPKEDSSLIYSVTGPNRLLRKTTRKSTDNANNFELPQYQSQASLRQRLLSTWRTLRERYRQFCSTFSSSEKHSRGHYSPKKSRSENRARKALRMIVFILGAFVICWTPYHILIFVSSGCDDCVNAHLSRLAYWLCYLNSPINPFCYAFMNAQFKKTFLRILRLDLRRL